MNDPTRTDREIAQLAARLLVLEDDHPAKRALVCELREARVGAAVLTVLINAFRAEFGVARMAHVSVELLENPRAHGWTFLERNTPRGITEAASCRGRGRADPRDSGNRRGAVVSDRIDRPPTLIDFDNERWEVTTYPVGNRVCVEPGKGLMGVDNWEMNPGARRFWLYPWRLFVTGYRVNYPKTEKQLRKSIAECQRWCDRANARDEAGRRLAAS